ncbi:hypothetical protein [Bacillus phage PK2]|nr:hypothetical protein [Bacillus phage PK2]
MKIPPAFPSMVNVFTSEGGRTLLVTFNTFMRLPVSIPLYVNISVFLLFVSDDSFVHERHTSRLYVRQLHRQVQSSCEQCFPLSRFRRCLVVVVGQRQQKRTVSCTVYVGLEGQLQLQLLQHLDLHREQLLR